MFYCNLETCFRIGMCRTFSEPKWYGDYGPRSSHGPFDGSTSFCIAILSAPNCQAQSDVLDPI